MLCGAPGAIGQGRVPVQAHLVRGSFVEESADANSKSVIMSKATTRQGQRLVLPWRGTTRRAGDHQSNAASASAVFSSIATGGPHQSLDLSVCLATSRLGPFPHYLTASQPSHKIVPTWNGLLILFYPTAVCPHNHHLCLRLSAGPSG